MLYPKSDKSICRLNFRPTIWLHASTAKSFMLCVLQCSGAAFTWLNTLTITIKTTTIDSLICNENENVWALLNNLVDLWVAIIPQTKILPWLDFAEAKEIVIHVCCVKGNQSDNWTRSNIYFLARQSIMKSFYGNCSRRGVETKHFFAFYGNWTAQAASSSKRSLRWCVSQHMAKKTCVTFSWTMSWLIVTMLRNF